MLLSLILAPLFILSFLSFACLSTALTNVTVDDQGVDPRTGEVISYTPANGAWIEKCQKCSTQPNPEQAFNQTWHDATYRDDGNGQTDVDTATFEFTGE